MSLAGISVEPKMLSVFTESRSVLFGSDSQELQYENSSPRINFLKYLKHCSQIKKKKIIFKYSSY